MKIYIFDHDDAMSAAAAEMICKQIADKPKSVLGLATGDTPRGTYACLRAAYAAGKVDFRGVTTFNLDEYYPMMANDRNSYRTFMHDNLFSGINISVKNTHIPNGEAADAARECRAYDEAIIAAGGIDLQLLGLGVNGHIGFNEPGDYLIPETHTVTLSDSTRHANARFFGSPEAVPAQAMTLGFAGIMCARRILLLASGTSKAEAIRQMITGRVMTHFPASFLRLHPDVTVICDKAAAAALPDEDRREATVIVG